MNFREEIDALPVLRDYNWYVATKKANYDWDRAEWLEARLALAAKIHAEPHTRLCLDNMADCQWIGEQVKCTCGKDAALAEVLGQ